ncbi:MAG: HAMP domain-containing sensor histidine kinase [Thermostichales cyanobacterium GMQP_bins_62]
MQSRFYPSLSAALWSGQVTPEWLPGAGDPTWQRVIAALHVLWQETQQPAIIMGSPLLWWPGSPQQKERWVFTGEWSPHVFFQTHQIVVPLLPRDPLREERCLWVMTPLFSALVVVGRHPHTQQLGMSWTFEPEVLERAWQTLQIRVQQGRPDCLGRWQALGGHFPLPDYRLLARFSTLLLLTDPLPPPPPPPLQLPAQTSADSSHGIEIRPEEEEIHPPSEAELLRALSHEIRTPLTSILTLIKLLLRRKDLGEDVRNYLEKIQRECLEQIDRFNLIFQAVEIESRKNLSPQHLALQKMPLRDLLHHHLQDWQTLVQRRGSTLDFQIPEQIPDVVSDPATLMRVLQGVIERIARSSLPGSHIQAQLVTAGEQVKIQLQVTHPPSQGTMDLAPPQPLGQLLIYQPDTGAISLSLPVTQALFRALGGYLTVKRTPPNGETVTIYLPCRI